MAACQERDQELMGNGVHADHNAANLGKRPLAEHADTLGELANDRAVTVGINDGWRGAGNKGFALIHGQLALSGEQTTDY